MRTNNEQFEFAYRHTSERSSQHYYSRRANLYLVFKPIWVDKYKQQGCFVYVVIYQLKEKRVSKVFINEFLSYWAKYVLCTAKVSLVKIGWAEVSAIYVHCVLSRKSQVWVHWRYVRANYSIMENAWFWQKSINALEINFLHSVKNAISI